MGRESTVLIYDVRIAETGFRFVQVARFGMWTWCELPDVKHEYLSE